LKLDFENDSFKKVKYCLIGNDITFDNLIAFILKKKNIISVGFQSRWIASKWKIYTNIINTLLIMDNYSKNNFKKNKFCLVKKYIVSGYVLKNFKKTITKKNKFINNNIICFDWSIGTDSYQNLNTNIYNLINFYDDILRLSNVYEDFNFIIKSKEKLKSYKNLEEIISKIKKKNNVYLYNLSEGINNFQKLYDNCNIIITKPSSTIDEGIFYGKKVLVHDYGISFDILIEKYENFNNQALFAHSYDDLKENLNIIITKNINNYHIRKFDKNYYFNDNSNFSFKNFLGKLNS
jgi:hypothetical protein